MSWNWLENDLFCNIKFQQNLQNIMFHSQVDRRNTVCAPFYFHKGNFLAKFHPVMVQLTHWQWPCSVATLDSLRVTRSMKTGFISTFSFMHMALRIHNSLCGKAIGIQLWHKLPWDYRCCTFYIVSILTRKIMIHWRCIIGCANNTIFAGWVTCGTIVWIARM